jgi:hypothetical protein
MSYVIQLTRQNKTYFCTRRSNKKDTWTKTILLSQATLYQSEEGAWRSIKQGDNLLLSCRGNASWYDLFVKEDYQVNVVETNVVKKI